MIVGASLFIGFAGKKRADERLEPLTCSSYECAVRGCPALQRLAITA
jgi:hypothetical protein